MEQLRFLHTIKKLRDESFQSLWYDKDDTAYNQTSGDVHLKGTMGEYTLAEYADLQVDVNPREDGDDGADHRAIILAPNYPNTPVDIDMKTASWNSTPPLLVRVDIDPDADYYVNSYLNEDPHEDTLDAIETLEQENLEQETEHTDKSEFTIETIAANLSRSHEVIATLLCKHDDLNVETLKEKLNNSTTVEIQGIASLDKLLGNEITREEASKKLLTQYKNFADWMKEECRDSPNWPDEDDFTSPEAAIEHVIDHSLKHGHNPLRDTVTLSIYGHLNYELSMRALDDLPAAEDIHGVNSLDTHHRNTNVDELLETLRKENEEQYGTNSNDNTDGDTDEDIIKKPDRYVNGTPIYALN